VGRPKLIKVDVVDGRGLGGAKNKTVSVQTRIPDILAFRDTPGFAYLLLAANPDVSIPNLHTILDAVGSHQTHSETWLYKRRFLFKVPEMPSDSDARVVAFMRDNMHHPVKRSQAELRRRGIKCSTTALYRIWMAIRYESVTDA
jgi:hypothetical protein